MTISKRQSIGNEWWRLIQEIYGGRQEEVEKILTTLTPREEKVIKMRFGLEDGNTYTLKEVGEVFGVGKERIRQIEAKAIRKLRHPSRSRTLLHSGPPTASVSWTANACPHCSTQYFPPETQAGLENVHIEDMNLSVRLYNTLKAAGISNLSAIAGMSEYDLLRLKYFGRSCLNELRETIAADYNITIPERSDGGRCHGKTGSSTFKEV